MTSLARLLPWDSAHFGLGIGRLERPTFTQGTGPELAAWMKDNAVACAYCQFAADDRTSPALAAAAGARFVDVRTTYLLDGAPRSPREGGLATRLARAEDLPALEPIAASAHHDSRFYFDPRFPSERADELFRIWLRKSVSGELANGAVTFEAGSAPAGYVTFAGPSFTKTAGLGEIGLVAVAEHARGRGAASALLAAALVELRKLGAEKVRVVTQGRNAAAQRLYQRGGFVTSDVAVWFHLWASIDPVTGIR